jgi:putative PIN family toxin of toxin-antitoxin system
MSRSRRVVFDTGTLVSAALRHSSPADLALVLALREGVVCFNDATLQHLHSVLNNRKWDRYQAKRTRVSFIDLLRGNAWYCPVSASDLAAIRPRIRDKRSNLILALAAAAEADAVVAIAPDLLARKSWRRIPIVTPAEFVNWYDPA